MSKERRSYTDEQFIKAVKTSTSIASVLHKIGLRPKGTNYQTVKNLIKKLNLA